MLCCVQRFHKEICGLMSRGNVIGLNLAIMDVMSHGVITNIDVFGLAVFCGIVRDVEHCLTVDKERDWMTCGGNL